MGSGVYEFTYIFVENYIPPPPQTPNIPIVFPHSSFVPLFDRHSLICSVSPCSLGSKAHPNMYEVDTHFRFSFGPPPELINQYQYVKDVCSFRVTIPENVPFGTPLANLNMEVKDTDTGTNSVFSLR
jgi:hypothetical protein